MDIRAHNRAAWDREVEAGNEWTIPVGSDVIAAARRGEWQVVLTPIKPVPRDWFGDLAGRDVLCLASGGGQQAPILAAAGARVTSYDNSPRQLEQDRKVADRDGLDLRTIEGDMRDLSVFPDRSFDLIFHPVSNLFVPEIRPVWRESFRVLRPGGALLAGFVNPLQFIFDWARAEKGELVVCHTIPYSDLTSPTEDERRRYLETNDTIEFGHSLDDQVGGHLEAGFVLTSFFEDYDREHPLAKHIASFIATRAVRPSV